MIEHKPEKIKLWLNMYDDYIEMQRDVKRKLPHLAQYISNSYYYDLLAVKYSITRNYIYTIFNNVVRNEARYRKEIGNNKFDD